MGQPKVELKKVEKVECEKVEKKIDGSHDKDARILVVINNEVKHKKCKCEKYRCRHHHHHHHQHLNQDYRHHTEEVWRETFRGAGAQLVRLGVTVLVVGVIRAIIV
ncbi:uncharacterized protein BCR38DRAFT_414405 [Pseudomassariella vexata]|uniref:Uncharacterized protein n=1 Tax=Pseudomassariella vexata TaxID=1141098 RepID=A0A1Y2DBL5_9PEZI|nr:uncharacterized protein BCR38DRAFT_414405 [Pseudomassariella vexata]ORY56652.1 hypothetical protein BCR38DRAFT_414405 [Pseudomassariella vexata]